MSKQKICIFISAGLMCITALIGTIYVLSGKTIGEYFIGHLLDGDGFTEYLALVSFIFAIISVIVFCIAFMGRGYTRAEKKELSKQTLIMQIGFVITLIASLIMIAIIPGRQDDEPKKSIWFILLMVAEIAGAITMLAGVGVFMKQTKSPIMR